MITLHSDIIEDNYTSYIKEHYDFDAKKANEVKVPSFHLPNGDWHIIAIIGASGSGKSTILNELGSMYGGVTKPHFDSRPIISNLGLPPKEASELLCAIGLASVPSWCRPLHNLSNGEQYRAKLAQIISQNDISFVDEFTSVIDRNSAKAMSNALQKYIRRNNKKLSWQAATTTSFPSSHLTISLTLTKEAYSKEATAFHNPQFRFGSIASSQILGESSQNITICPRSTMIAHNASSHNGTINPSPSAQPSLFSEKE